MPMVNGKEFPYTAKGKAAAAIAAMAPDKGAKNANPKKKTKVVAPQPTGPKAPAKSPAKKKAPPLAEKTKQYKAPQKVEKEKPSRKKMM